MNEFELIDAILAVLGPAGEGGIIGPGDDCAVIAPPPGELLVSSIDTLVGGVHFPLNAPGNLVGYRAIMVSVSDLAAMGAEPAEVLVALTLEETDQRWALDVAAGMREAILETGGRILGGNLARGQRNITSSVHGFCPREGLLTRGGAQPGDGIFVTGALGASAAAVALGTLDDLTNPLTSRYFRPRARIDAGLALRGIATSAIDLSDGLLQDLDHVCSASRAGADLESTAIPVAAGASLVHALHGGDDYELLFTAAGRPDGVDCVRIGTVTSDPGIRLDGAAVAIKGYVHFL
ncbi:MAG: thiamine-phosphate kinase [Pseudomonadales bacterium]